MRDEADMFVVLQNLRALERRGKEPELARTIAEVLDRCPQTNEAMAERAERMYLERELSQAQAKLEQTSVRLEESRGTVQRLQARTQSSQERGERLVRHNHLLTARLSGRRYMLADNLAAVASRTPILEKLVQRQDTAKNRESSNRSGGVRT